MNYIFVNKITGERHKIDISYRKIMLMRLLQPVSYILYGLIIATFLEVFVPSSSLSPIILVFAYLINIPMSLSKKGISFIDRIHNFLIYPITNSIDIWEYLETKNFSNEQTLVNKGNIYVIDFAKSLTKRSNIPLCIYLILNTIIVSCALGSLFHIRNPTVTFFLGLGAYAVSLHIALSPFGEWILRKQSGCTYIRRKDQLDYIEPIFKEVLEKARKLDSSIPTDVKLYMDSSEDVNAFATGRKTVCITEGMLKAPKEQIKATLAHEMGHIAHKDTDLILLVSIGNFIVTFIFIVVRIFTKAIDILMKNSGLKSASIFVDMIFSVFMWAWTKIGIMLVMKSNRANEFEADKFAFNLGYGNDLCELLDSFTGTSTKGLFANLMNSHPDKNDRIAALINLGVTYSKSSTSPTG